MVHVIYFWLLLTNSLLDMSMFLYFIQIKGKYVIMNNNTILELSYVILLLHLLLPLFMMYFLLLFLSLPLILLSFLLEN